MSIPDSFFEQNFAFLNKFLSQKGRQSDKPPVSMLCALVGCHYQLWWQDTNCFYPLSCHLYVKLSPGISQTIGRSAVIQEEDPIQRALCTVILLARYFKLAWAGNICNELLWRKLKDFGIYFYLLYIQLNMCLAALWKAPSMTDFTNNYCE